MAIAAAVVIVPAYVLFFVFGLIVNFIEVCLYTDPETLRMMGKLDTTFVIVILLRAKNILLLTYCTIFSLSSFVCSNTVLLSSFLHRLLSESKIDFWYPIETKRFVFLDFDFGVLVSSFISGDKRTVCLFGLMGPSRQIPSVMWFFLFIYELDPLCSYLINTH